MQVLDEIYIPDVRIEILPNENFRAIFQFWQGARGDRDLPHHSAISPARLPAGLTPKLSLMSVEAGPKRFRLRLGGGQVLQAVGANDTGKFIEDIPGTERMVQRQTEVLTTKKPYFSQGPAIWAIHDFHFYAALILPFADATGEVSRLLAYSEFM